MVLSTFPRWTMQRSVDKKRCAFGTLCGLQLNCYQWLVIVYQKFMEKILCYEVLCCSPIV